MHSLRRGVRESGVLEVESPVRDPVVVPPLVERTVNDDESSVGQLCECQEPVLHGVGSKGEDAHDLELLWSIVSKVDAFGIHKLWDIGAMERDM
ncbi:MAG: hypothetical protein JNJ88_07235 [Planctomycetes bacterium]|nr:hypothetical protein [Planctomycetota bacterium]